MGYDFGVECTEEMKKDIYSFTDKQHMLGAYGVVSRHTTNVVQLGFLVSDCSKHISALSQALHLEINPVARAGTLVITLLLVIAGIITIYCCVKNRGELASKFCPR